MGVEGRQQDNDGASLHLSPVPPAWHTSTLYMVTQKTRKVEGGKDEGVEREERREARKERSTVGAFDNCGSSPQHLWRTMGQVIQSPHSRAGHHCDHSVSVAWLCLCAETPV